MEPLLPEVDVIDLDAPDAQDRLWAASNHIEITTWHDGREVGVVFQDGRVIAILPVVRSP